MKRYGNAVLGGLMAIAAMGLVACSDDDNLEDAAEDLEDAAEEVTDQ